MMHYFDQVNREWFVQESNVKWSQSRPPSPILNQWDLGFS